MKPLHIGQLIFVALLVPLLLACDTSADPTDSDPVATDRVEMPPSYRFDPPVITVAVGTTVTFHNGDHFTHSVRVKDGSDTNLVVKPGESVAITFDRVGEFDYDCGFHPNDMSGRVIVTE